MTFLQGLFLLLFYMKYTDQLTLHGAALVVVLVLDVLWAVLGYLMRVQAQAKLIAKYTKGG